MGARLRPSVTPSPAEIDAIGIMAALRLAGTRALAQLDVVPDLVILDGNHDWLTDPARVGLLAFADEAGGSPGATVVPPVTTMIKADLTCSSVAAASVLAKVERDAMMVELAGAVGRYAWELNKGYSAPEHLAALSPARCRASTTAGRGGCPVCRGSRTATSPRGSRPARSPRGRMRWSRPTLRTAGADGGPDAGADGGPDAGDGSAVSDPPAMGDDERVWEVSVP